MDMLSQRGELYRDEDGHEMWRVRDHTGRVVAEGIASDHDARWIAEHLTTPTPPGTEPRLAPDPTWFDPTRFDPTVSDIRALSDRQLRDVSIAHPDDAVAIAARHERVRRSDEPASSAEPATGTIPLAVHVGFVRKHGGASFLSRAQAQRVVDAAAELGYHFELHAAGWTYSVTDADN